MIQVAFQKHPSGARAQNVLGGDKMSKGREAKKLLQGLRGEMLRA